MTDRPSLLAALTTSLSACTSLPTRHRVRTGVTGADDFDADIVNDADTLESDDIADGDESSDAENEAVVTVTVGVTEGLVAPLQGVVVAITPLRLPYLLVDLRKLQSPNWSCSKKLLLRHFLSSPSARSFLVAAPVLLLILKRAGQDAGQIPEKEGSH